MKERFYIFLFFLFLASGSYAQNKLAGLVLNNEDAPVVGAIVAILNKETNKITHSITTDSLGEFSFSSCPDDIRLSVAAFGYEAYMSDVPVRQYVDSKMEVRLKHIMLDEVVVTATAKPRMQRDGNKLVVDKLDNSPYAKGSDIFTFMRFIPALEVPTFEGNITLQETGGGNAVLLVNGKNINIPMDAYLKSIRAEDVERIEIVAYPMGEYKVRNGASVINLVMKRREDEGVKYNFFLADRQYGVNSQNGSFSVSYTGKKTYITSGAFVNNVRTKQESETNYKYYGNNLQTLEESVFKEKNILLSGYFNLDYELNKKNILGFRIGANGNDLNNTGTVKSQYGELLASGIDSVYSSKNKTYSPSKFTGLNTNANFTLKVDTKGSFFFADLDYVMSRPKNYVHSIFSKETGKEIVNETDILQKNQTHIDAYSAWIRYNHVFDRTTKLNSGISFSGANSRYNYFHGYKVSNDYIDDVNKTNSFEFDDYTLSLYSTFHYKWSNKLNTVVALRMEIYGANGNQKTTNEKISRHEIDFLPSLVVNYVPSDNHNFSVRVSSDAGKPGYYDLNPFKTYISPTTYSKGNPELRSNNMYNGSFSYTLFDDYNFTTFMMYINNLSARFTIPDENGDIMITPLNKGSMFYNIYMFSADKSLFNGYLYLSGEIDYMFKRFKNKMENVNANQRNNSFSFSLSSNITFSKKDMLSAYINYYYEGKDMGANAIYPKSHLLEISISKKFTSSSLSFGISSDFPSNSKLFYEQQNYGHIILRKMYCRFHASYSITFGNKKTRNVEKRANDSMNSRFEKLKDK